MPYTPNQWVDGDKSRPLSASRLSHMETQYDAAMADVPDAISAALTEDGPVKDELTATIGDEVTAQTASIGGEISSLQAQVNTKADATAIVIDGVTTEALLPNMPPGIYVVEP